MSLTIHRCGCFKVCSRNCSCQQKGAEIPCLLCRCCYLRNMVEPPLRLEKPPDDCRNPFNCDQHWYDLSQRRLTSTVADGWAHISQSCNYAKSDIFSCEHMISSSVSHANSSVHSFRRSLADNWETFDDIMTTAYLKCWELQGQSTSFP